MPRPRVLILAVAAVPVLVLGAGFVHGMYLAATGQAPPRSGETGERARTPRPEEEAVPVADAQPPSAPSDRAGSDEPIEIAPEDLLTELAASGLVSVVDGEIVGNAERFATFDVERAIAMFDAARLGDDEVAKLRMFLFAWFGELPPDARRRFAEGAGAWLPPNGGITERGYMGAFGSLFFYAAAGDGPVYERAIRNYAAIASSDEVLQGLREFGVYGPEPDVGTWRLRVEDKLAGFEPETLMAIHDRIELFYGLGDRKYLREQLRDLAAEKR